MFISLTVLQLARVAAVLLLHSLSVGCGCHGVHVTYHTQYVSVISLSTHKMLTLLSLSSFVGRVI